MQPPLTTDQFRILRNARDGTTAPACVFRPRAYFFDVEHLVRQHLVTAPGGDVQLTPLGAMQLTLTLRAETVPGD